MSITFRSSPWGPTVRDWEKMYYGGLANSFASPRAAEPMGNSIRRLVNETQGGRLPLQQWAQSPFAEQAPQAPTFESRLGYYKNRWRNMAPTASDFTPNMSFYGRTKIGSAQEYEAYMDQQARRKAQLDMDRLDRQSFGDAGLQSPGSRDQELITPARFYGGDPSKDMRRI